MHTPSRRQLLLGAALAVSAAGSACSGPGQAQAGDEAPRLPEGLRAELRKLAESRHVRGCSVSAATRDRTVYADGWGLAREGRAMTPASTLNIGSVSKTVTAAAVLQLAAIAGDSRGEMLRLLLDAAANS